MAIELWALSLLEHTARATVVLALAWGAARAGARRQASVRHAVWAAAFGIVLMLPVATAVLPAWRVPVFAPDAQYQRIGVSSSAPVDPPSSWRERSSPASSIGASPAAAAPPTAVAAATAQDASHARAPSLAWGLFIWAAVASGVALRYLFSLAVVAWMTRRAEPLNDQQWRDAVDIAAATLGLTRLPRLLVSSRVNVPLACGLFRPALVVPAIGLTWSDERIQVVCLHELAHVARRDCLVQAVTHLVCAFYWFNPLAWMGARQLRAERERACDDLVLSAGTRGADYAEHLLAIARAAIDVRPRLAAAAIAMARPSELEGRLLAILNPRLDRAGARRRLVWRVAVIAVAVALPVATVRLVGREAPPAAVAAQVETPPIASPTAPSAPPAATNAQRRLVSPPEHVRYSVMSAVTTGPIEADSDSAEEDGSAASGDADGDDDSTPAASPVVVEALTGALQDDDAEVRQSAMQALARLRSPATYDAFIAGLKDEDPEVRQQAAFGLSRLRDARASDALILALADKAAEVRKQAAFALSQLRTAQAVPALSAALKDPDDEVREQALFALSQIRDRSAVPALIGALSDRNADVRKQAAFALSQIGGQAAVPPLIAALRDPESEVREQAAFALSQIGDDSALEALTAAIKDPVADVRQQAIFAVSQIATRRE